MNAYKGSISKRELEHRRRRLQWIFETGGLRRRFRHRAQTNHWLPQVLLELLLFLIFLGVAFEFFF